jgi:hypothetical protein
MLTALSLTLGCSGDDGEDGLDGEDSAVLSGRITNAKTGAGLGGATLKTHTGQSIPVDAGGNYSQELPVGAYVLSAEAGDDYEEMDVEVSILAGVDQTKIIGLDPVDDVRVEINDPGAQDPGASFQVTAAITRFDGSTGTTFEWSQGNSVDIDIDNPTASNPTITLQSNAAYKDYLIDHLHTGDLDRWQVLAISPHAFEATAVFELHCKVTTSSGTYEDDIEVHVNLDFAAWTLGINNVPVGVPVLLGGRDQANYLWELASIPAGSSATIMDAGTRNAYFTPDAWGTYVVRIFDIDESENVSWEIHAGTYAGVIVGQEANPDTKTGKPTIPVPDPACMLCHEEDPSFDDWRKTGHAHILSTQIDTSTHYGTRCFPCHAVGYQTGANGIDDQSDWNDFLAKDYFHKTPGDNWTEMLADEPNTARMANIQCENCHGPNDSNGHMSGNDGVPSRYSLASELCAFCHGEPPRHGRYQQWEESGHGSFGSAESYGGRGSCAGCHSANGFMNWLPDLLDEDDENDTDNPDVTWESGEVQPITCVVCHDPHNVGTMSGHGNDAPMRIEGDTPMLKSGFKAYSVGQGAICMVCHNGRRGERNERTWPPTLSPALLFSEPEPPDADEADRAPHGGPQADVVMGENAYLIESGPAQRGPHGFIADTCVTCHVELTPPPAELSYNLGGTNHEFAAKASICADCHGEFTPENMVEFAEMALEDLAERIAEGIEVHLYWLVYELGLDVVLYEEVEVDDEDYLRPLVVIDSGNIDDIDSITITESHGHQAMTIVIDGVTYEDVHLEEHTAVLDGDYSLEDILPDDKEPGIINWGFSDVDGNGGFEEFVFFAQIIGIRVEAFPGALIAKAGWNYWTIHSDGSHGIHNPSFVTDMIAASFKAIEDLEYLWEFWYDWWD